MLNSDDLKRLEKIAEKPTVASDGDMLWLIQKVRDLHKEWQIAAQANFQLRQALKVVL